MPLEAMRHPVTPVGLHYLLIHYDIPSIDPVEWRLQVAGAVTRALVLSLDDLRAMPQVELIATMECAGNGRARLAPRPVSQPWLAEAVGTACWRGVRLRDVLDRAGIGEDAVDVVFSGVDRGLEAGVQQCYERALTVAEASREEVIIALEMNGAPLLPQHGFPARLVVPGWYAMTNVKWLGAITIGTAPFHGFQQDHSYRIRQREGEEGTPVTRMLPRALMVPPGVPDFLSRERWVDAGAVTIEGRAWSGWGAIVSVELSVDDGASWATAALSDHPHPPWAWRGWTFAWTPEPGRHVVCCRATDASGQAQPTAPIWNLGGYQNNAVQRVVVHVR
jgi:DMSO/TMAO reductase YedYZ molybdopterin-dependent catalytic subunit